MQTMMLLGRSQAIGTMSCPFVSTVGVASVMFMAWSGGSPCFLGLVTCGLVMYKRILLLFQYGATVAHHHIDSGMANKRAADPTYLLLAPSSAVPLQVTDLAEVDFLPLLQPDVRLEMLPLA